MGSTVSGSPSLGITYAIGGKQYVAVSTGSPLQSGGILRLTDELKPGNTNALYVFALPN